MYNLIGIYGDRGTGRKTAAWLLAQIIECLIRRCQTKTILRSFGEWVDEVIEDPGVSCSTQHVLVESFGGYILDSIKQLNPNLLFYDLEDPVVLDNYFVDLKSGKLYKDLPEGRTQVELGDKPFNINDLKDGSVLVVRDYILYIADRVIKAHLGEDFWLRSIIASNDLMGLTGTRIYYDVRTQGEIEYIRDSGGLLIHLDNKKRARKSGYRRIKSLEPDVYLNTSEGLDKCGEQFLEIAQKISEHGSARDEINI